MTLIDTMVQELVDALRGQGWYRRPQFLDAALVAALRADLQQRSVGFQAAAVGRGRQRSLQDAVRTDKTLWLTGAGAAQQDFLAAMEVLREALNRRLYLGLNDYEAHYAHYPPGAFYRRHFDTFGGAADAPSGAETAPRRVLSTVCYLNEDWRPGAGGELILCDRDQREIAQIIPTAGTAVFFLSEEFPHEVLPATTQRYSIAGWFRRAGYFRNGSGDA